jgi:drug/metabolite transporter (DMT)-like permease
VSSAAERPNLAERRVPPITGIGMASIALVAAGVISIVSYLPKHVPLTVPTVFLALASAALAANLVLLRRERPFAWRRFFQVARWALVAYVVIAGMILYAIVYDGTRGSTLAVVTLLLVVFTLNVPILLGFTVARFQDPAER